MIMCIKSTHLVVLLSLFYHSFGIKTYVCKYVLFGPMDGFYPSWDGSELEFNTAHFDCITAEHGELAILSPAYHSKPEERDILERIWVKSPLYNVPFSPIPHLRDRNKAEIVYIPKDRSYTVWDKSWYEIVLEKKEEETDIVTLFRVNVVQFIKLTEDTIEIVDYALPLRYEDRLPDLSDQPLAALDDLLDPETRRQLDEYIERLLAIRRAIRDGNLVKTVTAKEVILTHPHHSRDDNNLWVLGSFKHDARSEPIMELPFIGKSIEVTDSSTAFSLDTIERDGIDLDQEPGTNLKFAAFTPYGFSFTLNQGSKSENYDIYWYQQVYGGCVLHSLRSVLQKDGELLTGTIFNAYSKTVESPCKMCGRREKLKLPKHRLGEHCKLYDFCSAEAYLSHKGYGLLQLNMAEVTSAYHAVVSPASEASATASRDPEESQAVFERIMLGAFEKLFESDIAPPFLYAGGVGHAWTYMKIHTICDVSDDGYWLSLDSGNVGGAQRVYDIEKELKQKLLPNGIGPSYTIYAAYPPIATDGGKLVLHKIDNLWIPQTSITMIADSVKAGCSDDSSSSSSGIISARSSEQDTIPVLIEYVFDDDTVDYASAVLPVMLFLVFCFLLITIAGCICGVCAEDIIKKAFVQYKL